jgi:hypothetical protein
VTSAAGVDAATGAALCAFVWALAAPGAHVAHVAHVTAASDPAMQYENMCRQVIEGLLLFAANRWGACDRLIDWKPAATFDVAGCLPISISWMLRPGRSIAGLRGFARE